jgi:hypothetical protein
VDAKLESIVDQFKARLDELVPQGCRDKSLAVTNIEQAQLWAERARTVTGDNQLGLRLYSNPEAVGWRGWIMGKGGVEAWVRLDGSILPHSQVEDPPVPEENREEWFAGREGGAET